MPTKYDLKLEMAQRRNLFLSLMQKNPITMLEISDITGLDYTTVNYHLVIMECENEINYVKEVEKISYRGKLRKTYIALKTEYELLEAPPVVEVLEIKPVSNANPHLREFKLADKVMWTPRHHASREVRIGSTLGMMSY